ncbi:MAG: TolC family protein [Anaerohalosphaeraceae bacterium]
MRIFPVRGILTAGRIFFVPILSVVWGCKSPSDYRQKADEVSYKIIEQKQLESIGRTEPFSVERPSDLFRRRLIEIQALPVSTPASLGTDKTEPLAHWPEKDYPFEKPKTGTWTAEPNQVITLSLMDALQIGAANNFDYQSRKEAIFSAALDLDLARNEFRTLFAGAAKSYYEENRTGLSPQRGFVHSGSLSASQKLTNGTELRAGMAADLVNLLTLGGASSLGLTADASISVPLLRGSGPHIAAEPLLQAERRVMYAIWQFERYKSEFAVTIAAEYLGVLRQFDQVRNSRENYISAMASARQSRRLADAGRLPEIQVDQAVQRELSARAQWIGAVESYKQRLDSFKIRLGLPPDAQIELDRKDLEQLQVYKNYFVYSDSSEQKRGRDQSFPAADAPIEPQPPTGEDAGPFELPEAIAVKTAFEKRPDLWVVQGQVYDAQRDVIVKADRLKAELTFLGTAGWGSGRSLGSAGMDDARLEWDRGRYTALLNLNLPLERTAERNAYRKSYLALEEAVRSLQQAEDSIKLSIRNQLRTLLESREQVKIQAKAVTVAEKRQKSTKLFLDAGRAQIRDLLDAQDALLNAQNQLTASIINYRLAELNLQRDMGVLQVGENGLWKEIAPEVLYDRQSDSQTR